MSRTLVLAVALMLGALTGPVLAVLPNEMLPDPKLESRARAISRELRCLVCQNQSIDESNADLAHDLRVLVRERLKAGDSDAQVVHYVVDRYGAFVLLKPPLERETYLLWFGPVLILAAGFVGACLHLRRRQRTALEPAPLSVEEAGKLERILDRDAR
jgi:cytochrome c-type biogenesis protein CcmH